MRKFVLIAALLILTVGYVQTTRATYPTRYNLPKSYCNTLAGKNASHPDLDIILNFHGCDQLYDGPNVIGYVPDTTERCSMIAYYAAHELRLTDAELGPFVGDNGCVVWEDGQWDDE